MFLVAVGVAFAAGLLTPYFLAAPVANLPVLTLSAVAAFALLTCAGTKVALSGWGTARQRLSLTLSGSLTILFLA
jgi:hypothetical protein